MPSFSHRAGSSSARAKAQSGRMLTFMRDTRKDVLDAIKDKKVIDEAVEKALTEAITAFKQGWKA